MSWFDDAACQGQSSNVFFPDSEERDTIAALQVCKGCSVRDECLKYALRINVEYGVWGGTTAVQRRNLRRRRLAKVTDTIRATPLLHRVVADLSLGVARAV